MKSKGTLITALLAPVRAYVQQGYEADEDTTSRLTTEIGASIDYLRTYADPTTDFEQGSRMRELLCERVMRAEAGEVESFDKDFKDDVRSISINLQTAEYAAEMGYGDEPETEETD